MPETATTVRAIAEATGVVTWLVDGALAIVDDSPSWRGFTEQSEAEAAGTGWLDAIHPDDRAGLEALARDGAPWQLEHRVRRSRGRYTLARTRAAGLPDGRMVCSIVDVWADETVRRSEQRLRLATESAQVAVWEYDFTAGQMTRTDNHDALYGLPWQSVWTFDVFTDATHPDDRALSSGTVMAACGPGGADHYGFDFRVIWPDGSVHWLAVNGEVIGRDAAGAATLVRGALIDVTRLKAVEAELREALRIRDEFLQVASHELNTPLTPLKIRLEQLERAAPESLRRLTVVARRQVGRLAILIEHLLDVTRLNQGRLALVRDRMALDEAVAAVADELTDEAASRGCALQLALTPGVFGDWDRSRIEQVVHNLIDNATKYGQRGPVTIEVTAADRRARLAVRDRGIGIEPEMLPRIFDKFERAPATHGYGGLGLGLFIVRQIVELHGGSVHASSTPGVGTEVVVELPMR